jgi:hypothetical protein
MLLGGPRHNYSPRAYAAVRATRSSVGGLSPHGSRPRRTRAPPTLVCAAPRRSLIGVWPRRVVCADFRTTTERAFQNPDNHEPVEDEYGRPIRRLFSGRIKKRVDLKHEGESDEIIYQYTGEGSAAPNRYAIDEIYPEKFDDAAGQPSKTLFAKNARMRMVE